MDGVEDVMYEKQFMYHLRPLDPGADGRPTYLSADRRYLVWDELASWCGQYMS